MNYTIVEENNIAELMRKVNGLINLKIGWKPLGGLMAVRPSVSGPVQYCQAMANEQGSEPATTPTWPIKQVYKRKAKWHKKPKDENGNDPSPIAQGGSPRT